MSTSDLPAGPPRPDLRTEPERRAERGQQTEGELPYRVELQRKALHLIALLIPAGMLLLGRTWSLTVLVPLTLAAVAADVARARSSRFSSWLHGLVGYMMRRDECPPVGGRPIVNGATWVMISAFLLAVLFPVSIAAAAFGSFIVADAAAAVVGRRFGRLRWGRTRRTVEGSVSFVAVGMPVLMVFANAPTFAAAVAVLAGAAFEIPEWRLNDNVRVPLVMAAVLLAFSS